MNTRSLLLLSVLIACGCTEPAGQPEQREASKTAGSIGGNEASVDNEHVSDTKNKSAETAKDMMDAYLKDTTGAGKVKEKTVTDNGGR